MQATVGTTRFDPGQLKVAAIALGILVSTAFATVGVIAITDSGDASQPAVYAGPVASELGSYNFQEQNLNLPTAHGAVRKVQGASETAYIEQNTQLPGSAGISQSRVQSTETMVYLEQNTQLPAPVAPVSHVTTAERMRFLDANAATVNEHEPVQQWRGVDLTNR